MLVLHLVVTMRADTRLWEHAVRTKDDFLGRLAVVPLVQEARGLDAGVYASEACLLPAVYLMADALWHVPLSMQALA